MLKIRLQRVGRKNIPAFRIVLTDSQNSTKSGKYLEVLGSYNPIKDVKEVKADRVKHWISVGAKPTPTLHNFFISKKIIEGKKINVLPRKSPIKNEVKAGDAKPAAAPASEAKMPAEPVAEAKQAVTKKKEA